MINESGKNSNRWLIVLLCTCVAIGCALIGFFGYNGVGFWDIPRASRELDKAMAAYRAAGLPWEAKDLAPDPPVKPEENAAPLIQQVSQMILASESAKTHIGSTCALGREGRWNEFDGMLRELTPELRLCEQASERPRADFHRDWDQGSYLAFPEYASLKDCMKLFTFRAMRRAKSGDLAGCIHDLEISARLSKIPGQEPLLIGMLVQVECRSICFAGIKQCAATFKDDPVALERLSTVFEVAGSSPSFNYALRGEMYEGVWMGRNIDQMGGIAAIRQMVDPEQSEGNPTKFDPRHSIHTGLPSQMMSRGFLTRHLQIWTEIHKSALSTSQDPMALGRAIDAMTMRLEAKKDLSYMMEEILLPVFSQAGESILRTEADKRTSQALIRAMAIRARTGAFPKTIADIPGKWIDPFNNMPLHVVARAGSYRVYSVGPDLTDDEGVTRGEASKGRPSGQMERNYDIVAAYPPIKAGPTPARR